MASDTVKKSIRSTGDDVAGKADDIASSASTTASGLADKAKDHLGKVVDAAGDLYAKGADKAQDAMAEMPASLSDASAAGERLVRHGHERLHRGVRKQPVEALLLAGAIGYLVGWATSRS